MIYILSRTIAQGQRVGLASSLGVCAGALVHVVAAALGLSAILATSAVAFAVVKAVGAIYLFYLGVQALWSQGTQFALDAESSAPVSVWRAFRQGMLVDILNPKVAIFFMAFLPQFIRAEAGPAALQTVVLGLLVILVAIVVEGLFVLAAARVTGIFRNNQQLSVWLDRVLGTILLGLGIRLMLSQHRT